MMRKTFNPAIGPGVLGRLPLRVVEVSGDGDDRLGHLLAQVARRLIDQLAQNHRRDLWRGVLFVSHHNPGIPVAVFR